MTMALDSDLHSLWYALHELRDAVLPLRLLVIEDRPESIVPQPVQQISDALDDAFGHVQSAIESLSVVLDGDGGPREQVPSALARCNRAMLEFSNEWSGEVNSYHRLRQLSMSAIERGPAWRTWANSTIDGVRGCHTASHQVQLAMLVCWQSLAELTRDKTPCTSAVAKER